MAGQYHVIRWHHKSSDVSCCLLQEPVFQKYPVIESRKYSRVQERHVLYFVILHGEAPVVLRVTINGQRDEIRIQRSIPVELWDNAKMRSKGKDRSSRELNMYLETLRDRIYVIHRNSVYDGGKLTPKKILDILYAREGRHQVLKADGRLLPGICILPRWHVTTDAADW